MFHVPLYLHHVRVGASVGRHVQYLRMAGKRCGAYYVGEPRLAESIHADNIQVERHVVGQMGVLTGRRSSGRRNRSYQVTFCQGCNHLFSVSSAVGLQALPVQDTPYLKR